MHYKDKVDNKWMPSENAGQTSSATNSTLSKNVSNHIFSYCIARIKTDIQVVPATEHMSKLC